MDRERILQKLRELDIAHRDDGDGGYALVDTIKDWAETLDSGSRKSLWDVLLELISTQDPTLWGVSLEVLLRENPDKAATQLNHLINLNNNNRSTEWKDQVCLALLRLRHKASRGNCVNHIHRALEDKRRNALPLLAALCQVDAEACLNLSATYFGNVLISDESVQKHRGYIPAFIRNFLEVDAHLLRRLVERTKAGNVSSGNKLAALIDEYLARPAFAHEIGQEKVTALRAEVRS